MRQKISKSNSQYIHIKDFDSKVLMMQLFSNNVINLSWGFWFNTLFLEYNAATLSWMAIPHGISLFWQNHNFFQDCYLHNRMLQLCCKNVILKMKRYFYIDVFILLSECNFATLYLKCYWLKMEVLLSISQFSANLQLRFKIVGHIIQC